MKMRIILSVLVFILVCAFSAFVAWCAGYDFNQRNADVGFGVFMTAFFATFLSVMTVIFPKL